MTDPISPASLAAVQARIEQLAARAGIVDAGHGGIDETLAALPWIYRRRLVLLLESLRAFSPDPGIQAAAAAFEARAARIWAAMPFNLKLDETLDPTLVEVWSDRMAVRLKDAG